MQTTDPTPAQDDGKHAAAWAFVMDNYNEISRYARQMAAKTLTVNADELLNAGIVECLEHFPWFDPEQGAGATFCYWQVRRACTRMLRQSGADRRVLCGMNPAEPDMISFEPSAGEGNPRQMEARAELRALMAVMTDEEIEAVASKASGMSGSEVAAALGITMPGRNQRIYRLRRRLGVE